MGLGPEDSTIQNINQIICERSLSLTENKHTRKVKRTNAKTKYDNQLMTTIPVFAPYI